MKHLPRRLSLVIIAVVCLAALGALFITANRPVPPTLQPSQDTPLPKREVIPNTKLRAHDVLTLDDAARLLGPGTHKANTPEPSSNGEVNGMVLSLVGYQSLTPTNKVKNFAIALQTSMDDQAKRAFESARPQNAQPISDYEEAAYWLSESKQLHIYRDGNWLKISVFNIDENRDYLQFAEQVADIVVPRL